VPEYYSRIARSYDALHSEEQLKKAAFVKSKISFEGRLLDIGAGTGTATETFAQNTQAVILDPSLEMLLQCSEKKFLRVCARAEELPFKSNSFDAVVSLTALHHADLKKAFSEIRRVSRKNAKIAVSFFKRAKKLSQAKRVFREFQCFDEGTDLVFLKHGFSKTK